MQLHYAEENKNIKKVNYKNSVENMNIPNERIGI